MKRLLVVSALLSLPLEARAQSYVQTVSPAPYVPLASLPGIRNVTPFTFSSEDEGNATVPIPFTFLYLGQPYTEARVAANGYVVFGQNTDFGNYVNEPIGSPAGADNVIAVWWDDLILRGTAGFASYGTIGAAPNRIFVIEVREWERYPLANISDGNWQVWLYEGPTGRFEVRVDGQLDAAESYSATTGWEGPNGAPSGAFLPCSSGAPYCDHLDFSTMTGNVYAVEQVQGPELTGSVDAFPRGALPGRSAVGQVTLRNLGTVDAVNVQSQLYLSLDAQLGATDRLVGTFTVPRLSAGNIPLTVTATVNVPHTVPPGDYFLLLYVDSNDAVAEAAEENNVAAGAQRFAVGPDLSIQQLAAPGGADPGQPITFTVTVRNNGVPYAGNLQIRLIASPDPIHDVNDPILGVAAVALGGLDSEIVAATVTMPALPAGVYYPIAILDPNNLVAELNEFNNTSVSTDVFTSGPDFTIAAIDGPTQATPGQPMMVTTTIGSGGAPFTGQVVYRLLLSADRIYDAQDVVIAQYTVTFAGEEALDDQRQPLFPETSPPTGHYLIAVVDPQLAIIEANEGNNVRVDDQRIGSGTDFRVFSVGFSPSSARAGDVVTVTFTLRADGLPYSGPVEYAISLSRDGVPDPGDLRVLLGTLAVNGTQSHAVTATLAIGAAVPPGEYELIVEADPDDRIVEPSETNNWDNSFFDIDILGPNLIVSSIAAAPQAFVGIPYRVEVTLTNTGVSDAAAFRYGYYYTTNGLLRPPDGTELALRSAPAIPAGGSVTLVDMIDVPPQPSASRYVQFGLVLDLDQVVLETDEADNVSFRPGQIQILVPVSDLWARIDETSPEAAAGEDLAVTRTLQNLGVADSPAFTRTYYLSANAEISAVDDIPIGSFTAQLAVGDYDRAIDVLNVPATVPPGRYYLGLIADPANAVLETDETNNAALGPEIVVHPAALTVYTDQLPAAVVGAPYSAQLFATGPADGRVWSIQSGSLPPGLALDQLAGTILGTPLEDGLHPFTVRVTAGNAYAERALSLRVRGATVPIEIVSTTLPYAIEGRPYRTELIAVGGAAPYWWGLRSSLPPGLTATSTGGISGTPTQPGAYLLSVVVTDSEGEAATADVALNVISPDRTVAITPVPLPQATLGVEYCRPEPIRLYASGGFPGYFWSALSELPSGMSLSSEGTLCGAPEQAGEFPLLVRVQDAAGVFDTSLFILRVRSGSELTVTVTSLLDARVGQPYLAALTARQGVEPYQWRLFGGALPSGLELSPDGTISGTPSTVETAVFVVQVTDASTQVRLQPLAIAVLDADADAGCGCSTSATWRGAADGVDTAGLLLLFALALARWPFRFRRA